MNDNNAVCCPEFNPDLWQDKEIAWGGRLFVKDRVCSILHIPLNYGTVMSRNIALLERNNAKPDDQIILTDENSLWGADVYLEASREIEGARMATLSGTFLTKVFEGPYKNIGRWTAEMLAYVKGRGKTVQKLYYYYTTCPRCAAKYGKNYVVILAKV
jgi:hypothetical protein